jgi:flagellar biosynthesis/type III secretory pathway protein FliH
MGDDFIISGNYMQILDGRDKAPLSALEEHFQQAREEREAQTEEDPKPFLTFLLSTQNLEKEDLRLLKKKVAELRGREVEESLQALRGQEKRLEEVLQLGSREGPQQLDNILIALANTYSKDEISQIFGSEDNDEILNKLNEALCL